VDPKTATLAELDELIARGVPLAESYTMSGMQLTPMSSEPEWRIRAFVTSASATIDRLTGRDSQFYRQIVSNPTKPLAATPEVVMSIVGSLHALRAAVEKDHLLTLQQLAQAAVLDDFLAQSAVLLDSGYHVPAMVLVGGVIEEHLGKLCANRSLKPSGKPGLSVYNDALKGAAYDQPVWRRLQAIADLRNLAAHGKGAQVKADDVSDALAFARRVLADYPR
jgi:hypothetical protein